MSSLLRKILKASVPVALIFMLTSVSFGQLSLRRAMDYDGDNKADFAVFRISNSTWYIQRSTQGFTASQFGVANTDTPCPGDYDGDNRGDICVWRDTDGTFYYLRSTNGTLGVQQWGITGDEPMARQWNNNDNRTDFAVVRRSNNQMFWYILDSMTGAVTAVQFGLAGDYPIPGDYDGDNKFDYAVQRPTSSTPGTPANVYISKSTGGVDSLQYGFGNDFFAPGDYTGDGKTDLVAVREVGAAPNTALVWYIRDTATGNVTGFQFGNAITDFIAQNDYDGDGRTDVAVWRDTNGSFYVQGSTAGFSSFAFGASNDFPIANYDTH